MNDFFLLLIAGLLLVMVLVIYRLIKGPTMYDRLNGLALLGTNAIVSVLAVGAYLDRLDMVVDISLAFAILGFVSWVIIAKFFGEREDNKT